MINKIKNKLFDIKFAIRERIEKPQRIKRDIRFFYQRWTRGWDDSDTWNLNDGIVNYTLPRLRRFKELNNCRPVDLTDEQWDEILGEMIWFLEILKMQSDGEDIDPKIYGSDRIKKAALLFGEYLNDLWW